MFNLPYRPELLGITYLWQYMKAKYTDKLNLLKYSQVQHPNVHIVKALLDNLTEPQVKAFADMDWYSTKKTTVDRHDEMPKES